MGVPKRRRLFKRPLLQKRPPRTKFGRRIKDPFGNILPLKVVLTSLIGIASYRRLNIANKLNVEGMEHLENLPKSNVLFVSNHQTYYADVIALSHVFCSARWGLKNINLPIYLLSPRTKTFYIAAEETMKSGILPKLFSYAGAVTVKRAWRANGKDVQRSSDFRAPAKIKMALEYGWVITFPQGTTSVNAPVRKGAASLIKSYKPIVVPVKIDGFREAFGKKGLEFKKRGVGLSVKFQAPIQFEEGTSVEEIHQFLENHLISKEK